MSKNEPKNLFEKDLNAQNVSVTYLMLKMKLNYKLSSIPTTKFSIIQIGNHLQLVG